MSDATEVCKRPHGFRLALTCTVGTPPFLILPCYGPIRFARCPDTFSSPLPTLVPSRLERDQIEKEFRLEVKPRDYEIRFRFPRFSR